MWDCDTAHPHGLVFPIVYVGKQPANHSYHYDDIVYIAC